MRENSETFPFGQIFRLSFDKKTIDFYILTVMVEKQHYCLVNLRWGSRISDPKKYDPAIGVTWEDLNKHASYFMQKRYDLEPMKDVKISGTVMPSPVYTTVRDASIGRTNET
jgi:hypothetical protein